MTGHPRAHRTKSLGGHSYLAARVTLKAALLCSLSCASPHLAQSKDQSSPHLPPLTLSNTGDPTVLGPSRVPSLCPKCYVPREPRSLFPDLNFDQTSPPKSYANHPTPNSKPITRISSSPHSPPLFLSSAALILIFAGNTVRFCRIGRKILKVTGALRLNGSPASLTPYCLVT